MSTDSTADCVMIPVLLNRNADPLLRSGRGLKRISADDRFAIGKMEWAVVAPLARGHRFADCADF